MKCGSVRRFAKAKRTSAAAIVICLPAGTARWVSGLLQPLRTADIHHRRRISTVGGSLRDVQMLAGHAALPQRYIEADVEAQRKVVDLI